jgi:hypothetical protein
MDRQWWQRYKADVIENFTGKRYSNNNVPLVEKVDIEHFGNSGAACINFAAKMGAKRIIMLGYDCQHTGGKSHWHGDHPRGLGNAKLVDKWGVKFGELAKRLDGVEVINASRATTLTCFKRMSLEDALCA